MLGCSEFTAMFVEDRKCLIIFTPHSQWGPFMACYLCTYCQYYPSVLQDYKDIWLHLLSGAPYEFVILFYKCYISFRFSLSHMRLLIHMINGWTYLLPRSLSSPCIVVDGKTMLCGRNGLVAIGLVASGLGGAYEKYFARGERAFCYEQERVNKNWKMVWNSKLYVSVSCVCTVPLTLCVPLGCLSPCYSKQTEAPGYYGEQILSGQSGSDTSTIALMTQLPKERWLTHQSRFVTYSKKMSMFNRLIII